MVPAIHVPGAVSEQTRHRAGTMLFPSASLVALRPALSALLSRHGARCPWRSLPLLTRRCLFAALLCSLGRVLSWSLSTAGPAALPPASPASPPRPPTAVPLANPGHPACRTAAREWVPAALPQRWRLRAQAQPDENAGVLRARALNLSLTHTDTHTHTTHNTLSASSFASL